MDFSSTIQTWEILSALPLYTCQVLEHPQPLLLLPPTALNNSFYANFIITPGQWRTCVCMYSEGEYKLLLSIWNELGLEWDKEQSEEQRERMREVTHNSASVKLFKSFWLCSQALERHAGLGGGIKVCWQFKQLLCTSDWNVEYQHDKKRFMGEGEPPYQPSEPRPVSLTNHSMFSL